MTDSSTYGEANNSEDLALADLWNVLLRHKTLILATVLGCLAIGFFLSLGPRKYAADSMLRVQPGVTSQYRATSPGMESSSLEDEISPYVDILQSRTLYLKVAKDLDLANSPSFGGGQPGKHESIDQPLVRDRVLQGMKAQIAVVHKPKDEIIRVTASTTSPALSARVVNTLINDYVEYLFQSRYGASKRASGWLVGQLDDLKQQVEKDQTSLTELQAKLGVIGVNETGNDYLLAESLNSISKASSDATVSRIVAEAKYRFLQDSDPGLIEGEVNLLGGSGANQTGNLLQTLRSAQATQASNYARLLAQFGPNYPEVKQQKSQLDETMRQVAAEQSRILNQAKLSYSAASANEQMTEKALSNKQGEAFNQRGDMVKYIILLHDYQAHRTLYESLISRLQEAGITAGLEGGEIDIVDLANVPTHPAPPGRITYLGGALLAGLFLGFLLALLAEALNTKVVTADQARRATSIPFLGAVPGLRHRSGGFSDGLQDAPYMEAVDSVRAVLLRGKGLAQSPKVVLLTSPTAGASTADLSIYLSAALAQHHARVLLIDCDFRNGDLAAKAEVPSAPGLSDVLARRIALSESLRTLPSVSSLSILVNGDRTEVRSAVLLDSPEMRDLLQSARSQFDFVVLHGAPTLGFSDVPSLALLIDGVVLVIRNRFTKRKLIKRAETTLRSAGVPLAGCVLENLNLASQDVSRRNYRRMYTSNARETA